MSFGVLFFEIIRGLLIQQTLPGDLFVACGALAGFVMLFVATSILKFRQTL